MAKRWRIHPHDPDRIAALQQAAGIPAVVAQLLICRGITDPAAAQTFLDPKLTALRDPQLLPGCDEAARRIHAAVAAGKRIVVYGDYDVDGMTGTAILWLCLKLLGRRGHYYVPHRVDEGYGLNAEAVRALGRRQGVAAGDGRLRHCRRGRGRLGPATRHGLIVTDHHEPGAGPARRRGDRPSPAARQQLSLRRLERLGRGVQTRLGLVPTGQRGAKSQSADARVPRSRRSAWRRWGQLPTSCPWSMRTACWCITAWRAWPMPHAGPGHADAGRQGRSQAQTPTEGNASTARTFLSCSPRG